MSFIEKALQKKVCIVTGGRTGIGRAVTEEFLKQGAYVVVLGRDLSRLKNSFRDNNMYNKKLFLFEADIKNYEKLKSVTQEIMKRFGRIDLLINNAAINFMIKAEKLRPNMIDLSVDTNLKGHLYLTTLIGNKMKNQSGIKKIINITAYSGGKAYPGFSHFHACKAGLDALTRTLAVEWSKYKILVNSISPGPVLTKNFVHAYTRLQRIDKKGKEGDLSDMKNVIPLGNFIPYSDIVNVALFLASNLSNNITGQIMVVDGAAGINNEYFLNKLYKESF